MKRAALALSLAGASLSALGLSSACTPEAPDASGGAPASSGSGEGGSASSSGAVTVSVVSVSSSSGPPPTYERPDSVPEGWVSWAEWDLNCPMWFPPDMDHMPPPLEWEPCTFDAAEGLDCRQMKSSLAPWGVLGGITLRPMLRVVDGTPLLYFGHLAQSADYNSQAVEYLVVPPGGRPRFAMRQGPVPGCLVYPEDLNDGRFTLTVKGIGAGHPGKSKHDGLLLGTLGELFPKPVFRNDDELVSTWFVGSKFAIRAIARRSSTSSTHSTRSISRTPRCFGPVPIRRRRTSFPWDRPLASSVRISSSRSGPPTSRAS